MSSNELIGFGGLFLAVITAIVKIWYSHDQRITKLESRADVCDEKHATQSRLNLKQAEQNTKVDEHHVEIMQMLAQLQIHIMNIKEKLNEKLN
jgi:hypothetical protein